MIALASTGCRCGFSSNRLRRCWTKCDQILGVVEIEPARAGGENQAKDEYVGQRIMMADFVFPAHIAGQVDGLRDRLAALADLQADDLIGAVLDLHVHAVLPDDLDRALRRTVPARAPWS